jgi:predicted DNA-binding transcriptional regulator YafY
MSTRRNLRKYIRLVKILDNSFSAHWPTIKILASALEEEGFENTSQRTLERDIKGLREEFGIYINYCRKNKGYYLYKETDENTSDFEDLVLMLERAERIELMQNALQNARQAVRHITFEHNNSFKGLDYLSPLLKAIEEQHFLYLNYQAFTKDEAKRILVLPARLIEYRNRWYLLAKEQESSKLKTYGLDRIRSLEQGTKATASLQLNIADHYKHIFGITCLDEAPQTVVLSFTPQQGNYVKSLPLHPSQKIVVDSEAELRISLKVIINFELRKEILSYGPSVEVLEPSSLRQDVEKTLQETLNKYAQRHNLAEHTLTLGQQ